MCLIYEAKIHYSLVREGSKGSLTTTAQVLRYLEGAFDEDPTVEWFYVILLNRKNMPLGRVLVSRGSATATVAHAREVFKPAILASATGVICAHNHPSGDPAPSRADIQITRKLRDAGQIIGIDLIDHMIVGHNCSYYSFSEAGLV
ncbi:MAG: JAB domain-containing protein [Opitutaceae bacterium]